MCTVLIINRMSILVNKDWTEKADADAVFLPFRLRKKLIAQEVTSNGITSADCKCVNYCFLCNFEVISHRAIQIYIAINDDCVAPLSRVWGDI